jgi:hypothetical protein
MTRGGVATATVLVTGFGSSTAAALASASACALPTEENLPVAIQAAKPTVTARAASLWNLIFDMRRFSIAVRPGPLSPTSDATLDMGVRDSLFNHIQSFYFFRTRREGVFYPKVNP